MIESSSKGPPVDTIRQSRLTQSAPADAEQSPANAREVKPSPGDHGYPSPPAWSASLVLAAGAYFGHSWWTTGRYVVTTDDAYVGARNSHAVAQGVRIYRSDVAVEDNARSEAGDVIARIDDGDYVLAVQNGA